MNTPVLLFRDIDSAYTEVRHIRSSTDILD
jgi:hypothetical protein